MSVTVGDKKGMEYNVSKLKNTKNGDYTTEKVYWKKYWKNKCLFIGAHTEILLLYNNKEIITCEKYKYVGLTLNQYLFIHSWMNR